MEHSTDFLVLSVWLRKHLLVIRYVELLRLVNALESQGRISLQECDEILSMSEHLKIYDLAITE